jgi:hypothetical protein
MALESGERPLSAKITVAIVLVAFVALAVRVAQTLETPPDPLDQKLAGAEKYLYYVITPTAGPVFELTGEEQTVRLVTHAAMPPVAGDGYDPAVEVAYGVHVELDLGGGKAWKRDIYTRSRQSKGRRVPAHGGMWLDENAFTLEHTELSDDRLIVVPLPAGVPVGATMRVTLLGAVEQGLLRAYTPIPRPNVDRRMRDLLPVDRARRADQVSYLPWDRLAAEELLSSKYIERRLSAEGKDGDDYQTRTVYTTGFRLRYATLIERGTLVTPELAVAINVVGPTKLDLTITRPLGYQPVEGKLDIKLVGEGANLPPPLAIPLPEGGTSSVTAIDVPQGVFSVTIASTAAARLELAGPPAQEVALGGVAGAQLVPDAQAVPVFLSRPDLPPIVLAINGPQDLLGRVIRVDVRTLASTPVLDDAPRSIKQFPTGKPTVVGVEPARQPPRPAGVIASNLTFEAVDASGKVIATSTAKIESVVTAFETAKFFGKLTASVCEPINVRFVVPPAGVEVRLKTDKPAVLQMSTPIAISPPLDKVDAPYDSVQLATMLWRYARYAERGWMTVRPKNFDALVPDRTAMLTAQARLEPREIPPAPEINGISLAPAGRLELQTVVERVAGDEAAAFIQRWDAGHYTRILPGKKVSLDLSRIPSRPTVQYWPIGKDTDVVGATVAITIDGKPQEPETLGAAQGAFRLPAGLAGKHTVQLDTSAPVRMLIDRPPTGGGVELYALRSVYKIGEGRRVRVQVYKKSAAPQNVNIVVYARTALPDPKAAIRIAIDDGSPARIAGVALMKWTLADRTLPLPPADRAPTIGFANVARGGQLHPRLIAFSLGDDLPAGTHTVEVSVTGAAGVWGRFFTLQEAPITPLALQWRDATDTSEGSSP